MKRWGVIWAISVVLVGGAFFLAASRSYSPGPLSKGHAAFESQCANCHQLWHGVSEAACENCHRPERSNRGHSELIALPEPNKHASVKISEENINFPAAERIRAFNGVLGCLSCHHDHRGRMLKIAEVAADAGNNCTFCHHHPSIRGVSGHNIGAAGITDNNPLLRRKYVFGRAVFTFRSPQRSTEFKHSSHFDDLLKPPRMKGISTLPCEFCHQQESTSAEQPIEFKLIWLSGEGSNQRGCGVDGCHDHHSDKGLISADSIASKVAQYHKLRLSHFSVLRAEFRHSPGHLQHRCAECHVNMQKSQRLGGSGDASMIVKNCFSCHAHQPASTVLRSAAAESPGSWLAPVANAAAPPEEKRVVECTGCHQFHATYNPRTSVAEMDFLVKPLRMLREPPRHVKLAVFTIPIGAHSAVGNSRSPRAGITLLPLLTVLAITFAGIAGVGFVRWSRKPVEAADSDAPPLPIEIAYHKDNFETNIERLYVVGETAGIASINLAVKSGREAVETIASQFNPPAAKDPDVHDVAVVGCGPAGLGAATTAVSKRLSYVVLERMTPASSIRDYPRGKLVQAAPIEFPDYGRVFVMESDNTKEDLIQEWEKVISAQQITVHERTEVTEIRRSGDVFEVDTASGEHFKSRYVVVAVGVRGAPRRLGVPGENADRVFYKLVEPEEFRDKRILVVGGGNAGTEVAQSLADSALRNKVSYSFREPSLSRPSRENVEKIARLQVQKILTVYPSSQVKEILPGKVVLESSAGKSTGGAPSNQPVNGTLELENDFVFAMLGAVPPPFIKQIGILMKKRAHPT